MAVLRHDDTASNNASGNATVFFDRMADGRLVPAGNLGIFPPTYSSRLSQVELWFSTTARDLLARGIVTSTTDLVRKLCRYVDRYCRPRRPRATHAVLVHSHDRRIRANTARTWAQGEAPMCLDAVRQCDERMHGGLDGGWRRFTNSRARSAAT